VQYVTSHTNLLLDFNLVVTREHVKFCFGTETYTNTVLNIIRSVDNYKDIIMQLRLCVKILM